jgi:hypothetical protein
VAWCICVDTPSDCKPGVCRRMSASSRDSKKWGVWGGLLTCSGSLIRGHGEGGGVSVYEG